MVKLLRLTSVLLMRQLFESARENAKIWVKALEELVY